jgi:hypothetical protein
MAIGKHFVKHGNVGFRIVRIPNQLAETDELHQGCDAHFLPAEIEIVRSGGYVEEGSRRRYRDAATTVSLEENG